MTDHFTPKPKVVFIAGGFDALHQGHINLLTRARALGDYLIIGLNADPDLVRKGPGRPIDTWNVRAQKLMDTGLVYSVIWFTMTPLYLILHMRPDIIAVGDDYTVERTVGYPECLAWGGRVEILPRTPGVSTTQLVHERAREAKVAHHKEMRGKIAKQRELDAASRAPVDPAEKQRLIDMRPKLTPGNKAAFDIISNDHL